ncbi:hypothetical protein [Bradyrhizobium sp. S69]|uniref:hypothetical protein n=1 Tax=Bradyrhizobium sp. S69 TaxID=1641856 RepID=UPI001AEEC096|nr:hypothetical protein [Bradyrhizobium sp. S69]
MRAAHILLIATFACMILAPMTAQLIGFDPGQPLEENRTLAKLIAFPSSLNQAVSLPAEADDYLRDHFGLRRLALRIHDKLVWYILRESPSVQVTRGRDGTLFFNSHTAKYPYSLIATSCGIGLSAADVTAAADQVRTFLRQAHGINPASTLVIIPTKAPIYPELLPTWLDERCRTATPPAILIERQLLGEPELATMLDYPLEEMLALKTSVPVYPSQSFHWAGEMPRILSEQISEKTFGLTKILNFRTHTVVAQSDLQRFIPGIPLWVEVPEPDYAAAGVRPCFGPACFPEIGKLAEQLADVSRFRSNNGAGKKLLMVTDSFGAAIAVWFSQYFSEVWHLNVNSLINVSGDPINQANLSKAIFSDFRPDRVIYLFHDGAALYAPAKLSKILSVNSIVTTPNDVGRH